MNKSKLRRALGVGAILLMCSCIENRAMAQSRKPNEEPLHRKLNIQAIVDQDTRVYGHLRLGPGCGQGPIPAISVTKAPSSGTVAVKNEIVTLTAPNFGTCGPGHSGKGLVVYYKAAAASPDSFEYQLSSPGLPTTTWTVTVETR